MKVNKYQSGFLDIISAIVVSILLVGTTTTVYLVQQNQDTRKYAKADEDWGEVIDPGSNGGSSSDTPGDTLNTTISDTSTSSKDGYERVKERQLEEADSRYGQTRSEPQDDQSGKGSATTTSSSAGGSDSDYETKQLRNLVEIGTRQQADAAKTRFVNIDDIQQKYRKYLETLSPEYRMLKDVQLLQFDNMRHPDQLDTSVISLADYPVLVNNDKLMNFVYNPHSNRQDYLQEVSDAFYKNLEVGYYKPVLSQDAFSNASNVLQKGLGYSVNFNYIPTSVANDTYLQAGISGDVEILAGVNVGQHNIVFNSKFYSPTEITSDTLLSLGHEGTHVFDDFAWAYSPVLTKAWEASGKYEDFSILDSANKYKLSITEYNAWLYMANAVSRYGITDPADNQNTANAFLNSATGHLRALNADIRFYKNIPK